MSNTYMDTTEWPVANNIKAKLKSALISVKEWRDHASEYTLHIIV